MTDIEWPEGATHRITGTWIGACGTWFHKWVDGIGYFYEGGSWNKDPKNMSLKDYLSTMGYTVIEPYKPEVGECYEVYRAHTEPYHGFYFGVDSNGHYVIQSKTSGRLERSSKDTKFRPIKSEREQIIERAIGLCVGCLGNKYESIVETISGVLYDNGLLRIPDE